MSMVRLFVIAVLALPAGSDGGKSEGRRVCPARPASRARARALAGRWYKSGIRLYKQKKYVRAHEAFVCTQKILPAGLTQYWIARSAQDAGLVEEALAIFRRLVHRPPAPVKRSELEARISAIETKVETTHPRDSGSKQSSGAGAGEHKGSGRKLDLPPPRPKRRFETVSWALWGTGAGLLLAGVALGVVVAVDQHAVESASDGTWWSDLDKRYERRNGLLAGTWTLVGAGVLAAAAGTALYFLGRPSRREKVGVSVSSKGAGLSLSMDW